jgi:hypothetical protein
LGVAKEFQNKYHHCLAEGIETNKSYPKKKKNTTKVILKEE